MSNLPLHPKSSSVLYLLSLFPAEGLLILFLDGQCAGNKLLMERFYP